jgi:polysaccharide pyruvyl transferase WcaK-like protein
MRDAGSVAQVIVVVQAAEDRAASWQLAALLGLGAQHVVDDDLDPQQLIALYRACHLVVSSRLHGVILALVGGTPAISLAPAVTFKERAVLRNVGLEELCVATTDAPARLGDLCVRVARDRADYVVRIRAAVEAARHTLQSEVPRLLQQVCRTEGQD